MIEYMYNLAVAPGKNENMNGRIRACLSDAVIRFPDPLFFENVKEKQRV
jgi:hypothetical protein